MIRTVFADTGAAEETRLSALRVGLEKIDDLDARLEHLDVRRLLVEPRRLTMNRQSGLSVHRTFVVDRLAEHVQDAAERLASNRNHDRTTGVDGLHPRTIPSVGFMAMHRTCSHQCDSQPRPRRRWEPCQNSPLSTMRMAL